MKKTIILISLLGVTFLSARSEYRPVDTKSILLKLNNLEKCFILAKNNREVGICKNRLIGLSKTLIANKKTNRPEMSY